MNRENVFRIVRRRPKPHCEVAYEALVAAMFKEAQHFQGYLAAEMIPPEVAGGDYQIIQRFASRADLERWNTSRERAGWMEKLSLVADGDPEYRLLHGLDAWFGPATVSVLKPPKRWRLTLVSWLGIFPTVSLLLAFVAPHIDFLPFLPRVAVITALVAVLMSYVIMPRLTRQMAWWLQR